MTSSSALARVHLAKSTSVRSVSPLARACPHRHMRVCLWDSPCYVPAVKDREGHKFVVKILALLDVKPRDRDNALQEVRAPLTHRLTGLICVRLTRQAQLLSRLKHPNIVAYKESFASPDGAHLYIVMGFCDGGDLYTRCVYLAMQMV